LKLERWGSPLVQEKYREEKACDKRHTYRIIIIMIIIIIIPGKHSIDSPQKAAILGTSHIIRKVLQCEA